MKWEFLEIDERAVQQKYGTGKLTSELLTASSLSDEQIHEILSQDMRVTTSHADCVIKACERLRQAKIKHEKVFVGGDYDADGICSTAIMKKTLDELQIQNGYYIPDRFKEGYGLAVKTVEAAHDKGYDIIMTVDNGVKAHDALRRAKELGMYVIVTDHHEINEEIEADIVVHPDYMESEYAYLSGAGVALQIARNLLGDSSQYDDLIAICAVALIGDVMPLWRQTRVIVKKGISILKQYYPHSLATLFRPGTAIDETAIAFQIVPKLNSVGRMNDISNVNTLVPYLLSRNEQDMARYRNQLNLVNEKRKELSTSQTAIAQSMMDTSKDFQVLYDPSFHEGICGLIAGRIANQYHKPTLVMARNNGQIKGSGRSVPGFDMFSFFSSFEEKTAFGGHEQAVGIAIQETDFETFRQHIYDAFSRQDFVLEEPVRKAIRITPDEITFDDIIDLQQLSPYPKDMFEPLFVLENPTILETKKTPKTRKYVLQLPNGTLDAVLYQSNGITPPEMPTIFVGKLSINRFRGTIRLQMILEHVA